MNIYISSNKTYVIKLITSIELKIKLYFWIYSVYLYFWIYSAYLHACFSHFFIYERYLIRLFSWIIGDMKADFKNLTVNLYYDNRSWLLFINLNFKQGYNELIWLKLGMHTARTMCTQFATVCERMKIIFAKICRQLLQVIRTVHALCACPTLNLIWYSIIFNSIL